MLLLTCPVCDITADETGFRHGGAIAAADSALRGAADEHWQCWSGCRSWFGVTRHNGSQRIAAIWPLDAAEDAQS